MDHAVMIRADYNQIIVIVIHRANELNYVVNLNNSLIVRFSEVLTADLASKIIELL